MSQFINREDELASLQREYDRKGSSLVIMYGRRRVGKTRLITKFIENKNALFFLASEESEAQNRTEFKNRAADFLNNDLLRNADVSSWDLIFKEIINKHFEEKPVIVIDEFQYIGKSDPAFLSVFQRIWEEELKDRDVMVILCGSLISMMRSQTLDYSSPLYGRRTAQICLKQISFRHYKGFFPGKKEKELIELYSVTGGVPKYIELIGKEKDIFTSVKNNVLERSSYLYDEPEFLLQQEVSEIGSYFSVIKSIASGNRKLSDIAASIGLKATGITQYLKTLIDLDLVEREVPVTESNHKKSKKGLYVIKDNYISFWFKFVYPYKSFIESGNADYVMEKIRQGFVQNHVSYVYEDICREKMQMMNMQGDLPFHFSKIGRYWDKNTEIDIVALDTDPNRIIFGECKYRKELMGTDVLKALEAKAKNVAWNKDNREEWFVLFSSSGFTKALKKESEARKDVALYGGNEAV